MNGDYLPSSIYVQFGDDEKQALGLLSGIYDLQTTHGSVKWVARPDKMELPQTSVKQFRYCKSQLFWVFEAGEGNEIDESDQCEDWLVKSSATGAGRWNILTVANKNWFVRNVHDRKGNVQMKFLKMMKREEQCSDNDTFGPGCEFFDSCEALAIDATAFNMDISWGIYGLNLSPVDNHFVREFFGRLSLNKVSAFTSYRILTSFLSEKSLTNNLVLSHERPVWYTKMHSLNTTVVEKYDTYEVIMCLGRRWARMVVGIPIAEEEEHELTKKLRLANKVHLFEAIMKSVQGITSSFRYITHISEPFDVGSISDTGSPIGLKWYQADNTASFAPDKFLAAADMLKCECPVCPDGESLIPVENGNLTVNPDFGAFSPLVGKNLTCSDLAEWGAVATKGSVTCGFLQMASIFECGCPYSPPPAAERACPLCADDSPLDPKLAHHVPFPNGLFLGNATCEELSWGSNMRAELEMRDNENWYPTWQGIFGSYCGCPNPPKLPNATDIGCLSEDDEFIDQVIVENFEHDDGAKNGWYCGEILAWISFYGETENLNIEEWTDALSGACCVPKKS